MRVRFAPSPTGYLHVGNARLALINFLCARRHGGRFLLRLDDTDAARSTETYAEAIGHDLHWLGLEWDETFRQSARLDRYAEAAERAASAPAGSIPASRARRNCAPSASSGSSAARRRSMTGRC